MKTKAMRIVSVVCAALFALALAGCSASSAPSEQEQAQQANRQYMSQVNQYMMDIQTNLDDFSSAVEAGDLVAMRSALTDASRSIDGIEGLEAPEALADLQTGYRDGCVQLEAALNDYVSLFTEIENAGGTVDSGTYQERIASIQQEYDDGVQKLSDADAKAAEME